jgi:programmed cell death protein 4
VRQDKKQGGGHKGLWGTTDDGTGANIATDVHDPNYDSMDEDGDLMMALRSPPRSGYDPEARRGEGKPLMPIGEFKARVADAIKEFFVSEDLDEIRRCIVELDSPLYHYELVKRAISMSLDQKEREKELISRLLSSLYPDILATDTIGKGFERLFEGSDDLALDAPSAARDIATFLARAVVDEILPPSFLSDPLVVGLGGEIVDHAKLLLSRDHMGAR